MGMTVAQGILLLESLIDKALTWTPMVLRWKEDVSYLQQLQDEKGPDFVPTEADFKPYVDRLAAASAGIQANAARAADPNSA